MKTCPCCDRHCPVEELHCPKGRKYFGKEDGPSHPEGEETVLMLFRRCGHYLHHNGGKEGPDPLETALTPEEQNTLVSLLKKCLTSWGEL